MNFLSSDKSPLSIFCYARIRHHPRYMGKIDGVTKLLRWRGLRNLDWSTALSRYQTLKKTFFYPKIFQHWIKFTEICWMHFSVRFRIIRIHIHLRYILFLVCQKYRLLIPIYIHAVSLKHDTKWTSSCEDERAKEIWHNESPGFVWSWVSYCESDRVV